MSKVALFSDLHVHNYKDFAHTLPNGRNSRMQHTLDVIEKVWTHCVRNGIRSVLFGGDLFHKKGQLSVAMYQAVFEVLLKFKERDIDLVLLVGNHDQATLDGKTHAVKSFSTIAEVVDEPRQVELQDGVTVWCVPYMESAKAWKKALNQGSGDILLAHGGIQGAVSGPVEYQPPEQVEASDLPKGYGFRFFGHYHRRQKIAEKAWYIGSPLQHTRGERDEHEKGFIVYDTETKKFKVHELGFPEFVTLDWAFANSAKNIKGNFVDVTVDASKVKLEDVIEQVKALGAEAVNPIHATKARKVAVQRLEVDPSMSPAKLVTTYVKKYAPKSLDRDALLKRALAYLDGV